MIQEFCTTIDLDDFDVCVVGSGILGLALAHWLEAKGSRVLILEAGSRWPTVENIDRNLGAIVHEKHHRPIQETSRRALGGNSYQWGGRCVPLDPIDFEQRSWIQHSGWPITYSEVAKWYDDAARFLGVKNEFAESNSLRDNEHIEFKNLERWMSNSNVMERYSSWLENSRSVTCLINTPVIGFEYCNQKKSIRNVLVKPDQTLRKIQARTVVLACGGVNTTRLLLNAQKSDPSLFGGLDGPLGRYYMGHIFGKIGELTLENPDDFSALTYNLDTDHYSRKRLTFSSRAQTENKLPQITFTASNPAPFDANHKSGTFSAIWMVLASPIGKKLLSGPLRALYVGEGKTPIWPHVFNILRNPISTLWGTLAVANQMFFKKPRTPTFFIKNRAATYPLYYHSEQIPDADNRITLSDEADDLGMYRAKIHFSFSHQDVHGIIAAHRLMKRKLEEVNFGSMSLLGELEDLETSIIEQANDGIHQIGSTRMSAAPESGVVDEHCKVHGMQNLYIASTSVFPTSGQANPTFTGVSLAFRLADHLSSHA